VSEIVSPPGDLEMNISEWDVDIRHQKFISRVKSALPENERLNAFKLVAQTGEYPEKFDCVQ